MEMVAEAGCSGGGNCMLANDRGGAGAGAAPVELPRPQDKAVAETNDTPAVQPCKHFSIRRYVALVRKKNPKFCSLSQIFHGQQQYDECHSSLYPFPVTKFRPWDCSECLDKAEIPDHRTASRTVSMRQNGKSYGCSISFVGSTLVPTSVDFKSLFPCTQQLSQGKSAERSTLLKSTPESNSKCNSHSGVPETNIDPPMKDLQGLSDNHDATANTSDNAFVDVTALPEVSEIRANKEEHGIAIPSSPKLTEVTVKPNAEETGTREVLTVDHDTDNPKSISGQKGDQACNSGPCEETPPKRSAGSNCKKKKSGKPTSAVGVLDVKNGRRKQRKVRLLSEIINTDQVAGSRSDIEVDREDAADLCEDDRRPDDVIPVSHQTVGEMVSTLTKNKAKCKGVDAVDDGSSLMNWMKSIPKKLRTEKKDSEHKDFYSSAPNSKSSLGLSAAKDTHIGVLPSVGKLSKKRRAASINTQQGDENIWDNNLERNVQSTDDISQMESENYSQRSLSKVKSMSLSKRKMLSTTDAQHDDVIPVSHPAVGQVLTKTAKNKTKYKGVDVVDEGSSLMNWMKRIPRKLRTDKKDFDSLAVNSKSNLDRVASKDVQSDFVSSVGKFRKRKMLPATNTQQGDEILQNDNLERNVQNTYGISQNVKTTSLSKRQIPSTANAEHGDVDTENIAGKRAVLRTDDQCHMESSSSVQQHLAKVSAVKCSIHNMSSLEQGLHKKRKKQKQEAMHEKQAAIEDIPMDIVELLARNQGERQSITETDCSDFSRTQITEDEDCTIIAAEDGQDYASTVPSSTSQQKPLASKSNEKALQDQLASITQVSSTHLLELQMAGHSNSTQEQRTHLCMGEVVTIAASSPLLSQDNQSTAEPPADRSRHERAKKLMWDSFKTARRDSSSAATRVAQFRSSIEAVDVTSTHVAGAYSGYPTHQPVIPTNDYYTNRAGNQVQARSFPSTISTMEEAGNLHDRTNDGQPGFYSKETVPATHLLSPTDPSKSAGFPNYEGSYRNRMEFQLCNSYHAHNQYRGSASTSHGSNLNGDLYRGSASTSHGSNLNGHQYRGLASTSHGLNLNGYQYRGSASTSHGSNLNGNQYRGSASTSHGSNLNEKVPLTLEDLSWHRLQPNLHGELQTLRPLRPRPRVGVLSSLLQKEIANLSDNHGAQSGLRIGVSKGIPPLGINRRENVDALNSGTFSARLTALQLGSVSGAGSDYLRARNSTAQSWNRGQEKPDDPLERLVRKDICVVNRNPSETTVITDDNEYLRDGLI